MLRIADGVILMPVIPTGNEWRSGQRAAICPERSKADG